MPWNTPSRAPEVRSAQAANVTARVAKCGLSCWASSNHLACVGSEIVLSTAPASHTETLAFANCFLTRACLPASPTRLFFFDVVLALSKWLLTCRLSFLSSSVLSRMPSPPAQCAPCVAAVPAHIARVLHSACGTDDGRERDNGEGGGAGEGRGTRGSDACKLFHIRTTGVATARTELVAERLLFAGHESSQRPFPF